MEKKKWERPIAEVTELDGFSEIVTSPDLSPGENGTPILPVFKADDFGTL